MFDFLSMKELEKKSESIIEIPKPKYEIIEFVVKDKIKTLYKGTDEFWLVDEKHKVYNLEYTSSYNYNNLYVWQCIKIGDTVKGSRKIETYPNYQKPFIYEIINNYKHSIG
jgi:hypothetical protein